jgi:aminoglycoside phosphotransferase family enzyme/predicted kinase
MSDLKADPSPQEDIIAFLTAPGTLAPGQEPEVVETHSALIFLTKDDAYKIKRAVKYAYLDYSTPDLRQQMLERELKLNQATAPTIYKDILPITLMPDGTLAVGGTGDPVEWMLRMARFPASDELDVIAKKGDLTDALAAHMGQSIARYHIATQPRAEDSTALVLEIIEELEGAFADMMTELGQQRVLSFIAACRRQFQAVSDLLRSRSADGWVRRCHGDLHLRNIVLIDGVPTPFDALEFDDRLGTCDVLYDLAFLLMDLMHRDLKHHANLVLNGYLQATPGFDHAALRTLPLFQGIRAAIRAMVDIQTLQFHRTDEALSDGRAYLDQACHYCNPPLPQLVAIGGLSGTGKTTVARAIAHQIGAAPGAIHLRSDVERKRLFDVDPLTPLPAKAYTPDITDRVYDVLQGKAAEILSAGHSVILDATHLTESKRAETQAVADHASCAFTGIWLKGETETLIKRVSARTGDASDADAAVVQNMSQKDTGHVSWHHIDSDGSINGVVHQIMRYLSKRMP